MTDKEADGVRTDGSIRGGDDKGGMIKVIEVVLTLASVTLSSSISMSAGCDYTENLRKVTKQHG